MSVVQSNSLKFKYASSFTEKNYKSEFIISCLRTPKSMHKSIPWAKEMKIMNDLSAKIGDPAFWYHARPTFTLPSLAWFITPSGRKYLNEKWRVYNLLLKDPRASIPQIDLDSIEKIGEDIDLSTKPKKIKTLKDFLKK